MSTRSTSGTQKKAVSLYSLSDLKTTCDEQITSIITSKGYETNNFYGDVRLALGFGAVIVAGLTAFIDYKLGFFEAKYPYTVIGLVLYGLLNVAYTFWMYQVERGLIFFGTSVQDNTKQIKVLSKKGTPKSKYDPIYTLTFVISKGVKDSKISESGSVAIPFEKVFASNGFVVYDDLDTLVYEGLKDVENKFVLKLRDSSKTK